ncbi:hypothetical protein NQD34_013451 [Periophthalmus magnuspinnatus]|nr:hypothetical protein NQD34_013451 [Periophthalmus magnuspinnatus]
MWNNSSSPSLNDGPNCVLLAFSTWMFTALFILPLSIYSLILGYQRWRRRRSFTNSDYFTHNMSIIHLVLLLGLAVGYGGFFANHPELTRGGNYLISIIYPGELLIHALICVDRYLAVVHPISYMKFKQNTGVSFCSVSIVFVWLALFGYIGLKHFYYPLYPRIPYNCVLLVCVLVVTYCSVTVLRVLIRPRPGDSDRVDQSKRRALHTMVSVTAVLLLWLVGALLQLVLEQIFKDPFQRCVIFKVLTSFNIPSSVVLYVLFFHRIGKFRVCKKK